MAGFMSGLKRSLSGVAGGDMPPVQPESDAGFMPSLRKRLEEIALDKGFTRANPPLGATAPAGLAAPAAPSIGYSPDILEEFTQKKGGIDPLMGAVQSARAGEASADPELVALSPEDRAALDRYTNFAALRQQSTNPLETAANYAGGMGSMVATEAAKAIPGANQLLSALWNKLTRNPGGTQFFGGADVSRPSLANIAASHYGFTRSK